MADITPAIEAISRAMNKPFGNATDILDALCALPVEQRMEAMGMREAHYVGNEVGPRSWVEAR